MAFDFTNSNGNMVSIDHEPSDLIAYRFADDPLSWYNGSDKEAETISRIHGISYPKLMELRRSTEFKEAVEEYLENNGYEVNDENFEQAGVLGEKRQVVRHDPRASKHTVWGELVSETEDEIVIRKYPPIENEFGGRSKKDLIKEILSLRSSAESSIASLESFTLDLSERFE